MKKRNNEEFYISNRLAYVLMGVSIIILLAIGVYAYNTNPANPQKVGHSVGEITWPTCTGDQVLASRGGTIGCATLIDTRFRVTTSGICYDVPELCSTSQFTCSDYQYVMVDIGSNCESITESNLDTICSANCYNQLGYACNGDVSSCSGGTYVSYSGDGYCEGGNWVSCTCSASSTYTLEQYLPAGERCI